MSSLIKHVFIILLSFSSSLARDQTKYLFLSDEPCIVRPTLIDLNPVELKCHPFIISLDKCSRSCNVLSPKIFVPKETKDINVKAFNMIRNKNDETYSRDCKCKFSIKKCNSDQKWNNKTCQCEFKNYLACKNDYS